MWLRPQGYAVITDPDVGTVAECSTMTCAHCNRVQHIKPKQRPEDLGGLCKQCMGLVCCACVATGACDPFEEKLKRMEARDAARRSYGV